MISLVKEKAGALLWERKIAKRPGQAHVFVLERSGFRRSVCGTVTASVESEWTVADKGIKCATCRRKLDPDNAPKAPTWRE